MIDIDRIKEMDRFIDISSKETENKMRMTQDSTIATIMKLYVQDILQPNDDEHEKDVNTCKGKQ